MNNPEEEMDKYSCKIGGSNFLVRIFFKQHGNWQGTIQWLEANKTISFRSVLELISLLNEAVEKSSQIDGEMDFRSWDKREALQLEPEDYTGI